jgi:hypothetical protein
MPGPAALSESVTASAIHSWGGAVAAVEAARLEALADGPEIDAGSAIEVCVPVRVHRGRGAVDTELLVRVRREVADGVDRDPELERN